MKDELSLSHLSLPLPLTLSSFHATGVEGCAPCLSVPLAKKRMYRAFFHRQKPRKKRKKEVQEEVAVVLDQRQQSVATALENAAKRSSASVTSSASKGRVQVQTTIESSHNTRLSAAIGEMIYGHGLPFSLCESQLLANVVQAARCVGSDYKLPNRNYVGGTMLTASYNCKHEEFLGKLKKDSHIFGIAFMGDGATIKKFPLTSVLAVGVHQGPAVLDICDATAHMAEGWRKTGPYIRDLFKPWMEKVDPHKNCVDLILFDGASNVQLAGDLLANFFPRCTVVHGSEHVVDLVFSDIAKSPQMKWLIDIHRRICGIFGSGSRHGTHAVFSNHANKLNGGE